MELETSTTWTYPSLEEEEEVPVIEDHQEQEEALTLAWPRRTQRESYRRRRRSQEREYADDFFQPFRPERREMSPKVKDAAKPSEMSLRVEEAMKLLSDVWNSEMKAAVKHVKQSLLVTSAMMVVGAMVMGPPGLAVGGTIGGFLSFWMSKGKFKSVPQILKELPPAEKEKLCRQVRDIVRNLEWTDLVQLTKKVMANEDVRKQLLTLITGYVIKKL
ncbi:protein C19orf12-like [Myotis yumanensis]|uniref:protein C19orf12-like n=1 Tax=Myotis yumanensis TaxID=159337 RepID=UPI0038D40638